MTLPLMKNTNDLSLIIWLTAETLYHIHKQIEEFKIYKNKYATPKQKVFALMYSWYIDFLGDFRTEKGFVSPSFLVISVTSFLIRLN